MVECVCVYVYMQKSVCICSCTCMYMYMYVYICTYLTYWNYLLLYPQVYGSLLREAHNLPKRTFVGPMDTYTVGKLGGLREMADALIVGCPSL